MTTAIILRAFGSSLPQHRAARATVLADYAQAFPDSPVRLVLSSRRVREAEGLPDMAAVLEDCAGQGIRRVLVQHLLLVPGQMRAEAESPASDLEILHAAPLLAEQADIDWLAALLHAHCQAGRPNLVVVHGNTSNPQYNHSHLQLQDALYRRGADMVFASLEGDPGPGPMHATRSTAQAAGAAHIIPVFLFPGGHVLDDLLGSQADSWASQLGVPCTASPTLIEQESVRQRFIEHTRQALASH